MADTGSQLRSLYEPKGGVTEIFSAKVADYVVSRPDYPASLFEMLQDSCDLDSHSLIADIGAGTGLLTHGLLTRGCRVVAVEPNAAMRAAADQWLGQFPGYQSVQGVAESIPLASFSADLVTAAQAFHWFDIPKAKAECLRVLRPHGKVALIWNDRVEGDPLHSALDEVFERFGGAQRGALVAHEEQRGDLRNFFGATVPLKSSWPHEHWLNESGLVSLVFSRSYMPDRNSSAGQEASHHVQQIFRRFALEDRLSVRYTTIAIVGRPQ